MERKETAGESKQPPGEKWVLMEKIFQFEGK